MTSALVENKRQEQFGPWQEIMSKAIAHNCYGRALTGPGDGSNLRLEAQTQNDEPVLAHIQHLIFVGP